jgi:hypothetical protein
MDTSVQGCRVGQVSYPERRPGMSQQVYAIPVFRLESDDYSAPRGSHGYVDEQNSDNYVFIRWLPPHSGSSGPIQTTDLEPAGELIIPKPLIERIEAEHWKFIGGRT